MKKSLSVCLFVLGVSFVGREAVACEGSGSTPLNEAKAILACSAMEAHGTTAIHMGTSTMTMTLDASMATNIRLGKALKGTQPELRRAFTGMIANMASAIRTLYPNTPSATARLLSPSGAQLLTIKADGSTL